MAENSKAIFNKNYDSKSFLKANNDYFEQCLLVTIINNASFWKDRCEPNLNTPADRFNSYKDFTKPIDNLIYDQIKQFYQPLLNLNKVNFDEIKLSIELISTMYESANKNNTFEADNISQFKNRLNTLKVIPYSSAILSMVDACFDDWIQIRRAAQVILKNLDKNLSLDDIAILGEQAAAGIIKKQSDTTKSIADILKNYNTDELDDSANRIPIGNLMQLTSIMNGGIKKQETMLIIAPPGGGKTTISCQIAESMAEAGRKVLYISTEQPGSELLPKMISCAANIPYSKIMDGIKTEDLTGQSGKLNATEIERATHFINKIQRNLWFEDWCTSGAKIKAQLKKTIDYHIKEHGLDVVFIDWIGGGVDMEASKGDLKRFFLDECCRIIKDLAVQLNIAIIACSQANASKSEDVSFITAAEVSENTMLHTYFTWALGISNLGINKKSKEAQRGIQGEVSNKKEQQYFNMFKTRKSKGKAYRVNTNFEYSKFEEIKGVIGQMSQIS